MFSKEFWKDTLERVLYTMVEVLLGSMVGTTIITMLDWKVVGLTTLTSGIITLLKCLLIVLNKENKDE